MSVKALLRTTAVLVLFVVPAATAAQQSPTPPAPAVGAQPAQSTEVLQTPVEEAPAEQAGADVTTEQDAAAQAEEVDEARQPMTAEEIREATNECMQKRRKSMRRCTGGDLTCRSGVLLSYRTCVARIKEG